MSLYIHTTNASNDDDSANCDSDLQKNKDKIDDPFNIIADAVTSLADVTKRVEVWKWIYEYERQRCRDRAIKALEIAINISNAIETSGFIETESATTSASSLKSELVEELISLRCEQSLTKFKSKCTLAKLPIHNTFPDHTSRNPVDIIKTSMEYLIVEAWNVQLDSSVLVLSVFDLIKEPLHFNVVSVMEFTAELMTELSGRSLVQRVKTDNSQSSSESECRMQILKEVELVRQSLISKMLADVDRSDNASTNNMNNFVDSAVPSSTNNNNNGKVGINQRGAIVATTNVFLQPSEAEIRRREDTSLGFAVALLLGCCSSADYRL